MAFDADGNVIIERQPQILEDIEDKQRELIDPDIENRNDQVLSEINMIFSDQISSVFEFIEAVRDSWDIDRAEGFALDNLLALKKVKRIPESRSNTSYQVFAGSNGLTIPSGRVLVNPNTGDTFYTTSSVTLTNNNAIAVNLGVVEVVDGNDYSVFLDGYTITYTAQSGDNSYDILQGIATEASVVLPSGFDVIFSAEQNPITNIESLYINQTEFPARNLNVTFSTNMKVIYSWRYGQIEATETGPVVAPLGQVNQFQIPLTGIFTTFNAESLSLGNFKETDEEFRLRGKGITSTSGTGTVPAIENSILNNVDGVSSAIVIENDTSVDDAEGRPPKSFETIVVGGVTEEVGNELYRVKPAGIQSYGNTSHTLLDQNGYNRTVYFSRPTAIPFEVRVTFTKYAEEIYPVTGNQAIREAVTDYVNSLGLNKDLIPERLYGPIYSAVDGIDDLLVEINDGGGWTTVRYPIGQAEYASTTTSDITIVES